MAKPNGTLNGIPSNGAELATTMSPKAKIEDLEGLMLDIDSLICGKKFELHQLEQQHREIETAIQLLTRQAAEQP